MFLESRLSPPARRLVPASLLVALMTLGLPASALAVADPSLHYPEIVLGSETSAPYSAEATFPGGNPTATITSGETMTRVSGASVFLPADRGFGVVYGSSKDFPYLSVNGTSTTTTITFSSELPAGEIGIALGDIDAEKLVVTMQRGNASALTSAEMGAQTPFNHTTISGPTPTVTPDTPGANQVTIEDAGCVEPVPQNTQCDTDGATAWFQPTVGVQVVTISSTSKVGFPRFQLWMAFTASQEVTWTPTTTLDINALPTIPDQLATSSGDGSIDYRVDSTTTTSDCTVDPQTAEISATITGTCVVIARAGATQDYVQGSTSVTFTLTDPTLTPPPDNTRPSRQTAEDPVPVSIPVSPAGKQLAATGPTSQPLWALGMVAAGVALVLASRRPVRR